MPEPEQSKLIELQDLPAEVEFRCPFPRCGLSCKFYPRSRAVVHQIPECPLWRGTKGNQDALNVFLIRAGLFSPPPANKS